MKRYLMTARMSMRAKTNGGLAELIPETLLRMAKLVPLLFLWESFLASGVQVDMTLPQLRAYTYLSALLASQLTPSTSFISYLYEGTAQSLYQRPQLVFGQTIAQTVGEWGVPLLLFSLPMALLAPLFGIRLVPASAWFFVSLLLTMSLGFAIDFLFISLMVYLRNAEWQVHAIRSAIVALLSGNLIPLQLLPWGLDRILIYQPFASLGGAALSLFTGIATPMQVLPVQVFWNLALWPLAVVLFGRIKERLVSFGG